MAFDQEKARGLAVHRTRDLYRNRIPRKILTAYGLPVIRTQIATTEAQAGRIAREMGYPVVMKTALTGHHP